jgi:hypothetical protein
MMNGERYDILSVFSTPQLSQKRRFYRVIQSLLVRILVLMEQFDQISRSFNAKVYSSIISEETILSSYSESFGSDLGFNGTIRSDFEEDFLN